MRLRESIVPLFLVLPVALAGGGCVKLTWRDRALRERPDLGSPERTFETLRAAIRLDDPILAYATLSEAMKERDHFTLLEFSLGWDAFFAEYPFARLLGNSRFERRVGDAAEEEFEARGEARAYGQTIRLAFLRQDYFEVRVRGRAEPIDGFLPSLRVAVGRPPNRDDALRAILVDPRFQAIDPAAVESFTVASSWKILEITPPAATTESSPAPTNTPTFLRGHP